MHNLFQGFVLEQVYRIITAKWLLRAGMKSYTYISVIAIEYV